MLLEALTQDDLEGLQRIEMEELSPKVILVAYEKLFGGGRGVQTFGRSGLRYVDLAGGAVLIEQNQKKQSRWAEMAREGHQVAWVMREGKYLARVIDGEVLMLGQGMQN